MILGRFSDFPAFFHKQTPTWSHFSTILKTHSSEDLQRQLGNELADVIHYAVAIAALNGLDMNKFILEKDKTASVKYGHRTNLEQFVLAKRGGRPGASGNGQNG